MKKLRKTIRSVGEKATKAYVKNVVDPTGVLDRINEQGQKEAVVEDLLKQKVNSLFKRELGKEPNYDGVAEDVEYEEVLEDQKEEVDERKEVDENQLAESELQQELEKKQIKNEEKKKKLTEEQIHNVQEAEKSAIQSNSLPGTVPGKIIQNQSTDLGSDNSQDAADKQQEIDEEKQTLREDIAAQIEKAKAWLEDKKVKIRNGPYGLTAFFSSTALFVLLGFIDSIVSGGIPVAGDFIMFGVLAVFWIIACVLINDVASIISILFFLAIDLVIGLIGGTAANALLPGIGDAAIDFIPELYVLTKHKSPPEVIRHAYERKIPNLINAATQSYQRKVAAIKDEGRHKLKHILLGMRGRFSGAGIEGQKVIFIGLAILLTIAVQVWGVFGFSSTGEMVMTALLLLVLMLIRFFGFIGQRELIGLGLVLLLNLGSTYISQADNFISQYLNSGNSLIVTVGFIFLSVLLIIHIARPESMSTNKVVSWFIVFVVMCSIPYMFGYFSGPQFAADIEAQRVETEAELDSFNFWERATNWVIEMQQRGEGTYIPSADQERVHEFIGITMSSIEATRNEFVEGQPVQLNIQYETGSKEEILVLTNCDIKGLVGNVTPAEPVPATELYTPIVRCIFAGLPKGSQLVTVNAFYNYESRIEIPLYFMTDIQQAAILDRGGEPETFIGDIPKPRTSSGPVDFGVSNRLGDNPELELPLVYDPTDPNRFPQTIFLTLRNPVGNKATQGDLRSISRIQFDMPEGLHLSNCDFMPPGSGRLPITARANGRWIVDVTDQFETFRLNDVTSCDIVIDEQYTGTFLPATGYSLSTMYFNIDYTYGLTQTSPVTVT